MPVSVVRLATIIVAVTTYHRPQMLREALTAVARLRPPPGTRVRVLVIDNDPARTAESVVRAAVASGQPLEYRCEPVRGLAAVRNRALDAARAQGATALAFCDDDEVPDQEWLGALWHELETRCADLVGGPVLPRRPSGPLTLWARMIFLSVAAGAAWGRCARRLRRRCGGRVTLATNNWMLRLALLERQSLRFDPRFALSGGEDTDFFRRLIAAGGRTAWTPRAHMRETVPANRLRCRYVFRRRFDSGVVRAGTIVARHGRALALLRFLPGCGISLATALVLLIAAPVTLLLTLPPAFLHLGRGSGYLAGLCGWRSQHYRTTTGF